MCTCCTSPTSCVPPGFLTVAGNPRDTVSASRREGGHSTRVLDRGTIHCRTHSQYVSEYTSRTSNSAGHFDRQQAELWKAANFRRRSFCTCAEGWLWPKTWARIQELYFPWLWFRRWIQLLTLESKKLANRLKFGRHFQQVRDGQVDRSQTSHLFRCFDSPWWPSPTHKEWQQSKPPL